VTKVYFKTWIMDTLCGEIFSWFRRRFSLVSFVLFSVVVPLCRGSIPLVHVTRWALIQFSNHRHTLLQSSNHRSAAELERSTRRRARWKTSWIDAMERERMDELQGVAQKWEPRMPSGVNTRKKIVVVSILSFYLRLPYNTSNK